MNKLLKKFLDTKAINANELEQALIRFTFVTFLLSFLVVNKFYFNADISSFQINLCAFYLIVNIFLTAHIFKFPKLNTYRISITMFVDILMTSIELAISGSMGSILIGIYLWLVIGYGIRYKGRMLLATHVTAIIGFTLGIYFNPYWREHIYLAYGMGITLLLVPIHTQKLLGKLDAAFSAAKKANDAKSEFLSHISHELRTPLNGVIGASDLLEQTKLNTEQNEYVSIVQNSSKQLYMLISDVLDLAKIESGKMELKTNSFNLNGLLNEVDHMFNGLASAKGLDFSLEYTNTENLVSDTFLSDPMMIKQIILNLIGNAVKFTEEGFVKVTANVAGGELNVVVEDSGIGISDEKLPLVFGKFNQVHDSTISGTGLGTSISKELVTLLGGDIGVTSELGKGSKFFFNVPIEASETIEPIKAVLKKVRQLRILIADDNNTNLHILSRILENENHHVVKVKNGEEALDILETEQVDLMLLDINMPKHTGIEVVQLHSAIQGGLDLVPAIILSADANVDTIKKCKDRGIDHYLTKPIDKVLLFNTIASIFEEVPNNSTIVNFEEFKSRKTSQESLLNLNTLEQLSLLENDDNFIHNLVNDYIHNAEGLLSDLKQSIDDLDYKRMNNTAHNLIGASLGLGCDAFADQIQFFNKANPGGATSQKLASNFDQAKASYLAAKQELLTYRLKKKTVT